MSDSSSAPLVSILTPVHDEEAHLAECVDSILAQTYERWHLVIVNNGSTDRSLEIANDYASRDDRISVHDNEDFLPQIENFNAALAFLSPESRYCKMVLADDRIMPTCLERMVAVAESSSRVGLVGAYLCTEREVFGGGLPRDRSVFSGRDVCRYQLLTGRVFFGSPTAQLWRAEVVRDRAPFFRSGALHPDTEACYELLGSWDFGFSHEILTFWRTENDSTLNRVRDFNFFLVLQRIMLARYGPEYLATEDLKARRSELARAYRSFLSERLLRREGAPFWEYHRRAAEEMGQPLSRLRMAALTLWALLDLLLNPLSSVEVLFTRGARKREAAAVARFHWGDSG